jgi:hypothetical protein
MAYDRLEGWYREYTAAAEVSFVKCYKAGHERPSRRKTN